MKKFAIALCLAITFVAPVFAQNPCDQNTKLNASASGVQTWNGTKSATTVGGSGDDAYGVEAWTEAGGNATKLTWFGPNQGGGYAFRAEWTNSTDYLGRFGYFWGNNGKKWDALGNLCVDYNYTRSANGTGGSYSYLGIYGWTIGNGTSAEYYIVEDWFGNGQQGANNLGNNCQARGNITVDGNQYQVVTCIRPQGSGCVSCGGKAFGQVFSIRQGMASNSKKCGTISIKKHFEEWSKISGASQYIYNNTYESKFLVEAAGGTGWFEASYMKFSRTGACGGTATPSSSSAAVSSSSKPSSSSVAVSSSSRAASSSSSANSSVTLSCTGLQASVEKGGTIGTPTLTCSNGSQATNITWTGRPGNNGSWAVSATTNTTSYIIGATATCGSASGLTATCGTVTVVNATSSSSSRASSSSAASTSSSSRASSSSVAGSSSSNATTSSSSVASETSSSSEVDASSSSEEDLEPILKNRVPVTYFSIQPQSDKSLRIEISSPAVVEIFDLKGNKVEKFNVSSTQQTVKLSSPSGVYFAKVHGVKSIRFVLK